MTQRLQIAIQNIVLVPVIDGGDADLQVPLPLAVVGAVPLLQRLAARVLGMGFRPEHVRAPLA